MSAQMFSGVVQQVVFCNRAESYYVIKVLLDTEDGGFDLEYGVQTATGYVPGFHLGKGTWLQFSGKWEEHPKFGSQIKILRAPIIEGGWSKVKITKLLTGMNVARSILRRVEAIALTDEEYADILSDPGKLIKVQGIDEFTAHYISERWNSTRSYFQSMGFLYNLGLSQGMIRKIWGKLGDEAEKVLSVNPWKLVEIGGIRFNVADSIAIQLDLDMDNPYRIEAAVYAASRSHSGMGHLFTTVKQLFGDVRNLAPEVTAKQLGPALVSLHKGGSIFIDKKTHPGVKAIYKPWFHLLEEDTAHMLVARNETAKLQADPKRLVSYLQRFSGTGPNAQALTTFEVLEELAPGLIPDPAEEEARRAEEEEQLKEEMRRIAAGECQVQAVPDTGPVTLADSIDAILDEEIVLEEDPEPEPEPEPEIEIDYEKVWGHFKKVARAAITDWASGTTFNLSDDQKQGIFNALVSPVSIITGLPGTGKTTSLRALVRIFQDMGLHPLLMAPTGIAAKRIKEVTGADAFTIHRAFGARGGSDDKDRAAVYAGIVGQSDGINAEEGGGFWEYGPGYPHSSEVLIVDESSMLDQHLIYRILYSTSSNCRIVFVGDAAQLPSVGPGNVLRDLVDSQFFPMVNLTEIFRQAETSQIVFAAHDIYKGAIPDTSVSKEFKLIPKRTDDEVLETVLTLAKLMHGRSYNFQVLSPKHRGKVGVTNLNERLRELLNPEHPSAKEMKLPGDKGVIREGDRVMIVKNNYELGVFNGDVGRVVGIDLQQKSTQVKIQGATPLVVPFNFKQACSHIRLAYACTVHKMQGLEADRILMPMVFSFAHQLQRNLFYTAVTRARKQVIMVGALGAMERAVRNDQEDLRNTLFLRRLASGFEDPEAAVIWETEQRKKMKEHLLEAEGIKQKVNVPEQEVRDLNNLLDDLKFKREKAADEYEDPFE